MLSNNLIFLNFFIIFILCTFLGKLTHTNPNIPFFLNTKVRVYGLVLWLHLGWKGGSPLVFPPISPKWGEFFVWDFCYPLNQALRNALNGVQWQYIFQHINLSWLITKTLKKIRINSLLATSLRKYFVEDIFFFLRTLAVLPLKIPIFLFTLRKSPCYTQFKIYSSLKTHNLTKSTFFCKKNLELIENIFFIRLKKIINHFVKKKF